MTLFCRILAGYCRMSHSRGPFETSQIPYIEVKSDDISIISTPLQLSLPKHPSKAKFSMLKLSLETLKAGSRPRASGREPPIDRTSLVLSWQVVLIDRD